MSDTEFTPTQKAMLEIFHDGLPHRKEELHECCGPSSLNVVQQHVSELRKKLRPIGQDIVCVYHKRAFCYQQIRLLASANDGRR